MKSSPRILDVWCHVEPRFGGVGPAASSLASAISEISGTQGQQIAVCDPMEDRRADGIDAQVSTVKSIPLRGIADVHLAKSLRRAIAASDVCHVHGLWLPHCLAARRVASDLKKPIVSSAHGMLERWELQNKWLKKSLYSLLFERPSLSRSSCVRALSEAEAADYRRFGMRIPIALIPNGIHALERVRADSLLSRFPALKGKSIVLFLGRIHRKKGVLNLLDAWKRVALRHDAAHLLLVGPDCGDTGVVARQIIAGSGLSNSVTLAGVLSGELKLAALSYAKYFCLPSFSEGLSVAVLEALSIGLPPVVTSQCNFSMLASSGAGLVTSNEPAELAETLISCLSSTSREWQDMSRAAEKLARSEFDWGAIARRMNSVYEWLLGGPKPACVVD